MCCLKLYSVHKSHVLLLLVQATTDFQIVAWVIDVFRIHLDIVCLPGVESNKRLGWQNAVLDLSLNLFIK